MALTENGWPSCGRDQLVRVAIPGSSITLEMQQGIPATIMGAFAAAVNQFVETLRDDDSASWTATNSVATSNHLGGTAMDLNWNTHPFHVQGTFDDDQIVIIRQLLEYFEGTIFWAGDWQDPIDEMHWQMGYNTYTDQDHCNDFISRKIVNGRSLYRADSTPVVESTGLTAEVLSEAMGGSLSLERYAELIPGFVQGLHLADCNTVQRVATWCAEVGHESLGLLYMEEIADGSEYNGNQQLGNTDPGDGERFKGRGPIQITGRYHYRDVSKWAFDQGIVPTADYFVTSPDELGSDQYDFLGVVWYWTVARDMNSYADAGDIVGASYAVNGGDHGLQDRIDRYNHCLQIGEALLPGELTVANVLDQTWVNWQGGTRTLREYIFYTDKFLGILVDQLVGPDAREQSGEPTRWAELGDQTMVEALASIGTALKIEGFKEFVK